MAGQRRREQEPAPRTRAAVLPLPRRGTLGRVAPSQRSLAIGLGLIAIAAGAYAAARQSSAFSIGTIEVSGAPPTVQKQVRQTLAPLLGTSLLALDGSALERRVESLPTVVAAHYDRSFPHTLRLHVIPETPVAVVHRGKETWLVSARGRVVTRIPNRTHGELARIWVTRATPVAAGAVLPVSGGGATARALALAARFPARIAVATLVHGGLLLRLRSGLELRLGAPTDVRLKLAIARQALAHLPAGTSYVDVSAPGRPVAGSANSQLSGRG
ncbi:MAG: cell division protein FtsQ [Gaiellaceae bacterium]|nr:cell division protein FtsQ [Gaiellaceae bacterium]